MLKDSIGWGFVLWLIGYLLGLVFFFLLPPSLIGWGIMPIGVAITVWVLMTRIHAARFGHYLILAMVWPLLAVVLDYLLIVKAFNPPDGYYKLDVYLYYALTFALPLLVGWWKAAGCPARDRSGSHWLAHRAGRSTPRSTSVRHRSSDGDAACRSSKP